MNTVRTVIFLVFLLSVVIGSYAEIINAGSASQADVQAAIDASVTGDIVNVPADNRAWPSTVVIPTGKRITLRGAGIGATVISRSGGVAVDMRLSGSRLTGFSFNEATITVDGDGWRIDHVKLNFSGFTDGIKVSGSRENDHPTGLIDHIIGVNMRVVVIGWNGLLAHGLWAQPLNLGSGDNVVYIEDSDFTGTVFSNAMDANYGGRYVFRNNTLHDSYIEAHSVQGIHRAAQK